MNKQLKQWGNMTFGMAMRGIVVAVLIWVAGSAITAGLIAAEVIGFEQVGYAVVLMLLVSSFAAAKIMLAKSEANRIVMAALSVGLVMLLLLGGNRLVGAKGVSGIIQTMLVVLAGAACAVLIPEGKKRRKYRRKH